MTGRACKRKGSKWESDIVKWLLYVGRSEAKRLYGAGRQDDRGDIAAFKGVVLEAKNQARMELGVWSNEAERERVNDGADYGIVVAKRRGKGPAEAYAVMPFWQLELLMKEAGR